MNTNKYTNQYDPCFAHQSKSTVYAGLQNNDQMTRADRNKVARV